jgi:hypothetical protein
MGVESGRVLIRRIIRLLTWESRKKHYLDVAFMACHKKYYKGKVMVCPKSGA